MCHTHLVEGFLGQIIKAYDEWEVFYEGIKWKYFKASR